MSESIKHVDFSIIRYANVWEDAEILLQGLNLPENKRILSIASGGDNVFALLTTNPDVIVAFDISLPQLYLVELKKVAIRELKYEDCVEFLGFYPNSNRLMVYNHIARHLSTEARTYWNNNLVSIDKGVIHIGKFEKYFQLFSHTVLPLIHFRKTRFKLFEEKTEVHQREFYLKKWNTWRWRLLFSLFFSKWFMGKKGRDAAFLNEVKTNVGQEIFNRSAKHLSSVNCQKNGMLHYIMQGEFGDLLPYYMHEKNYAIIKANLHKIQLFNGFPNQAIDKYGKFDAFNLSDIFEYMPDDLFNESIEIIKKGAHSQAKIAYWNLLVERRISKNNARDFEYLQEKSEQLSKLDAGFFYNCFIVDQKIS